MYDALNRVIQASSPANPTMRPNVIANGYDPGGSLTTVDVWLQQAVAPAGLLNPTTADRHLVTSITYNALGQRAAVAYGNGVGVSYAFDPLTFRLTRLTALRPASFAANARIVQDLRYFHDPVGDITRIRDDADIQNVVFFANRRVEPSSDYTYDPLYRLISAQGREHLGQTGNGLSPAAQVTEDESFRIRLPQPGDGNAMGTYVENYSYDVLGNILSMAHVVASGGWTRHYAYAEASRIIAAETDNRLSATSLPGDPAGGPFSARYAHDAHGNMTQMPHLQAMVWSEDDRLRAATRTAGGATPPTTYYTYASGGERIRKVVENQTATRTSERIYLGSLEVYREFASDGTTIDLSRESLAVMAAETVARVETRTLGSDPGPAQQVRYQLTNHLQSAMLELGDNAEVISYEEYFPFGATSYQAVASQTDVAKRYRFDGCERDAENGLDRMGARYYAAWLGRWTACDPEGMIDGPNLFRFARNSPTVLRDPLGTAASADAVNPPPPPLPPKPDIEDVLRKGRTYHWGGKLQEQPPPGGPPPGATPIDQPLPSIPVRQPDDTPAGAKREETPAPPPPPPPAPPPPAPPPPTPPPPAPPPPANPPGADAAKTAPAKPEPRFSAYGQLGVAGSQALDQPGSKAGVQVQAAARVNVAVKAGEHVKFLSGPTASVAATGGRQDKSGVTTPADTVAVGVSLFPVKFTFPIAGLKTDVGIQVQDAINYNVTGSGKAQTHSWTNVFTSTAQTEFHLDEETSVLAGVGVTSTSVFKTDSTSPASRTGLSWSVVVRRTFNFP
jgi:RHS repeat-associated protein